MTHEHQHDAHDHGHAAQQRPHSHGAHEHDHGAHEHSHGSHSHGGTGRGLEPLPGESPAAFWERRYGDAHIWSGRVNEALAAAVAELRPGRSLDLGCGEGGDVLWLAEQGWDAAGIDLSASATDRARAAAAERGIDRARFVTGDLGEWLRDPERIDGGDAAGYDLVTASFLQSPVELPRGEILRAAAARVAPGGSLVIVSHGTPPSWAKDHPGDFPSPEDELALLDLDLAEWELVAAELRLRHAQAPDGAPAHLDDTVIIARRR